MSKEKVVPEIRFEGFSDDWDKKELSKVTERVVRKNFDLVSMNPLTISAQAGLISQLDYYNFQVASKNLSNYYLLSKGDFAYNKSYSNGYPVGAIKRLDYYEKGLLSTLYIVFRPTNVNSEFLKHYYESNYWHKGIYDIAEEGARNHGLLNVAPIQFFETHVNLPVSDLEQSRIGNLFEKIEGNIKKRDHEIYKLKNFKQSMLQKMFPKEGEIVPEVRFKGFEEKWKEFNLGEITNITTGKLDANAMVENGRYDFFTSGIKKYKINNYAFEGPAITIAGNGATVGYMHLADGKFNAYQRTYVLSDFAADRIYLFYEIQNRLPKKIKEEARTGNIPYIVMDMLSELSMTRPSKEEQILIGSYFQTLDDNIQSKQAELDKLKQFKQAMLDKMFV